MTPHEPNPHDGRRLVCGRRARALRCCARLGLPRPRPPSRICVSRCLRERHSSHLVPVRGRHLPDAAAAPRHGRATSYDMRYADAPILDEASFAAARPITARPDAPGIGTRGRRPPGTRQSVEVNRTPPSSRVTTSRSGPPTWPAISPRCRIRHRERPHPTRVYGFAVAGGGDGGGLSRLQPREAVVQERYGNASLHPPEIAR